MFTSILEPILFREKIKIKMILCSVIMLIGVVIISSGSGSQQSSSRIIGVILGLTASFLYAVISLLNRNFSNRYAPEIIVFYEQASAAVVLLPLIFLAPLNITSVDYVQLGVYGIIFTACSHGLFVKSLRHLKVTTAGIISGLEAVYSIILASFLLKELPLFNEIIGGLIIIGLAGYMTLLREKQRA